MNAYISNDGKVNQDVLIFIKINLGICFYKIGLLEEAYTCFETCVMSYKNKCNTNATNTSQLNGTHYKNRASVSGSF